MKFLLRNSTEMVMASGLWLLSVPVFATTVTKPLTRNYEFHTTISQSVLENYLSRALQYPGICDCSPEGASTTFEDDLRVVRKTGAKFLGRAAYAWSMSPDDERHFTLVADRARTIHKQDPDIILQACVFEIVGDSRAWKTNNDNRLGVNDIAVPAWVFEAFDLPVEVRNFDYDAMYTRPESRNFWGPGFSIPDITQTETQMWFYYRARRYVDSGCEAIHIGQMAMIGEEDPKSDGWDQVLRRVREYAKSHARRGLVLFDAHVPESRLGMLVRDGRLVLDFVSFPLRPRETTQPLQAVLVKGAIDTIYGVSPGGLHPQGWTCEVLPQLYEFDNCKTNLAAEGGILVWGADESTWFANQPASYRDAFMKYAYDWIWHNSPHGYLQMPGRRPAQVPVNKPRTHQYVINNPGPACPDGFGQEDAVTEIWNEPEYRDVTRPRRPTAKTVDRVPNWEAQRGPGDLRTLEELRALYKKYGVN